jgi:hypothetical protein
LLDRSDPHGQLLIPNRLAGTLPSTDQAQAAKAINKLTPEACDQVTSIAGVKDLIRDR